MNILDKISGIKIHLDAAHVQLMKNVEFHCFWATKVKTPAVAKRDNIHRIAQIVRTMGFNDEPHAWEMTE